MPCLVNETMQIYSILNPNENYYCDYYYYPFTRQEIALHVLRCCKMLQVDPTRIIRA